MRFLIVFQRWDGFMSGQYPKGEINERMVIEIDHKGVKEVIFSSFARMVE
ncbi:unknown protein [Waddlia chondrophila 2032/99]|uniref:Uncharacterized protein n=1 Tax=Waddlia chondrophila 2032/99 TaxID=765953 RepID=F8LET9_9BACT|nr:unknown protein [Waddlia chondrophila 2032/99]